MLKELAGYDCTYAIEIQAEAEYQEIIEQELKLLVSDNRDVRLQTLQDFIVEHQSDNRAGFTLAYAIAAILVDICGHQSNQSYCDKSFITETGNGHTKIYWYDK